MKAFKPFHRYAGALVLPCLLAACHGASKPSAASGDTAGEEAKSPDEPHDPDHMPAAGGGAGAGSGAGGAGASGTPAAHGGSSGAGGPAAGGGGAPSAGAGGALGSAGASGSTGGALDPSTELFAQDSLPRFDITLSQESMDALSTDPTTYVRGSIRYGAITLNDVAVRIKGEASLRGITQKAAFKIKTDEFVAGQNLLGLKRITLNNMAQDPTFLSERLAYQVYAAAKLPAPRCNNALVYVNDDFYGVYANVESEDKVFLRRFFSNVQGNLYEDAQVDFEPGNEAAFQLQTNEALNDRSDLRAFTAAIAAAKDETFLSDMDATLDTAHFLKFTAVEGAVDQWDMYGYTYFDPNNFRLYHDPASGKFTFLPWGMDLSLKPFLDGSMVHVPLFKVPVYENKPGNHDAGGLIFRRCLASPSCKNQYAQALKSVADLYDAQKLDELAAQYYAQIKEHVYRDWRKEYSNEQFEDAYQSLLTHLRSRSAAIRGELQAAGY